MNALLWIAVPSVAVVSVLLSFLVMYFRLTQAIAREREEVYKAHRKLQRIEAQIPERLRSAEERAQQRALEAFLTDIRVEERRHVRQTRAYFPGRHTVVLQERLYFRDIPLSGWVDHEMPVNDESELHRMVRPSVFRDAVGAG